ncbi:hypothetical protein VNO78_21965 [Psophocarpus tetragonolobus]|uniref:Uncharacterized protein n=1 Tax=Psophocarpus tetragonolobus TaxID=3891 RepID=A0AAN9SE30_PSOTE
MECVAATIGEGDGEGVSVGATNGDGNGDHLCATPIDRVGMIPKYGNEDGVDVTLGNDIGDGLRIEHGT